MESFTTATNSARDAMRVSEYAVIPHGTRCANVGGNVLRF
jgi:hypothetical protein